MIRYLWVVASNGSSCGVTTRPYHTGAYGLDFSGRDDHGWGAGMYTCLQNAAGLLQSARACCKVHLYSCVCRHDTRWSCCVRACLLRP